MYHIVYHIWYHILSILKHYRYVYKIRVPWRCLSEFPLLTNSLVPGDLFYYFLFVMEYCIQNYPACYFTSTFHLGSSANLSTFPFLSLPWIFPVFTHYMKTFKTKQILMYLFNYYITIFACRNSQNVLIDKQKNRENLKFLGING